jgi:hypothetical protein
MTQKTENHVCSLNSPSIFIILDIHQQNAQITNKVQSALYHSQTLHTFRLSMSHHQGFSNSAFQMLDRSANDTNNLQNKCFYDYKQCKF